MALEAGSPRSRCRQFQWQQRVRSLLPKWGPECWVPGKNKHCARKNNHKSKSISSCLLCFYKSQILVRRSSHTLLRALPFDTVALKTKFQHGFWRGPYDYISFLFMPSPLLGLRIALLFPFVLFSATILSSNFLAKPTIELLLPQQKIIDCVRMLRSIPFWSLYPSDFWTHSLSGIHRSFLGIPFITTLK